MILVLDSHLHIYPNMSMRSGFDAAEGNLAKCNVSPAAPLVFCLTERFDCNMFDTLAAEPMVDRLSHNLIKLTNRARPTYLCRGYQIISLEGIEILGICLPERIADKTFTGDEVIRQVEQASGIPVMPWGLGKWLGKRGQIRREMLDRNPNCLVATTSLHPTTLRKRFIDSFPGRRFVYGSDPLPATGEEQHFASSVTLCTVNAWDEKEGTIKHALMQAPIENRASSVSILQTLRREAARRFQLSRK